MANTQHLELSHFIKKVHENLRNDSKKYGIDKAWKEHCSKRDMLDQYAAAMHELASKIWENNYAKENTAAFSRINWIFNYCNFYFYGEEILRQRLREKEIGLKINLTLDLPMAKRGKIRLLDVGSCYNPFKVFECFDVTAIDIAPATADVALCDFLNVDIATECLQTRFQLQEASFDVVVFSLFLEYLPTPEQRLMCCQKAYNLLTVEGILLIVTPDSKHVGANAKIMKSWRFLLAGLGFSRIKYEKLSHIHCMAFRKSLSLSVASRWADLQDSVQFFAKMYIPQDFNSIEIDQGDVVINELT
uniref:S-adenosylmethionine sensor upstream of mTORC1 n=1 Tax=Photinus pyralis TaxID=7054 RepID=A0A1Y1LA19_PHOPY